MDLQQLENDIWLQMRNGRDEIYVKVQELQELRGEEVDINNQQRQFIEFKELKQLIDKYKEKNKKKLFRESLKVDIQPEIVKNLIDKIDTAEKTMKIRNEDQWSK